MPSIGDELRLLRMLRIMRAVAIAGIVLLAGGILAFTELRPPVQVRHLRRESSVVIGGPFMLIDGNGRTVTDRGFRGKFLLVYFGYTHCPDVCPTTLSEVATALRVLGPKAARLQPLFITVDPTRDTPAVMGTYVATFSPRLIGLTGTPEQIAAVAHEYRVYYAVGQLTEASGTSVVSHSSYLYLMSPDGRFIAPIRAGQTGDAMAAEIARDMSRESGTG